jgi:hypothetical protein
MKKCVICDRPIDVIGNWTEGHNALPITEGRCCTNCNENKVLPARMGLKKKGIGREEYGDGTSTYFNSDFTSEDGEKKLDIKNKFLD